MNVNDLRKRWVTAEGKKKLQNVIDCLKNGHPLSTIKNLNQYQDRWDLRGSVLSLTNSIGEVNIDGHELKLKTSTLQIGKSILDSIDFSYSDLRNSYWNKVLVKNCVFHGVLANQLNITSCNFQGCTFTKTNFRESFLNKNSGKDSGSFVNTKFIECDLSRCSFNFPEIENCVFESCNLFQTDFDGSRFKNTIFKGKLDSLWFRGYSIHARTSILGLFKKIEPKNYPNRMLNVDFSKTEMIGVSFSHGIDLTNCIFPIGNDYLFIENSALVFSKAKNIINKYWEGEDKRTALLFLSEVLLVPNSPVQKNIFVDKHLITDEGKDLDFGEKFFDLLCSVNSETSH